MNSQLLFTASLFGLLAQPIAASDDVTETDDQDIDEIVIVGQKSEKTLREVTTSVSVETGAEIEREPLVNLSDIVLRVPNVTSSFGNQGFAIRGVDQRGVGGSGLTLTVYVDDAPLSNQTTFFGPLGSWDLQQVEVYRGPQSTNFGRNTVAGAIYVRTKDPEYEWGGKGRVEVGNNGQLWGAIAVGGPIIDDKLAFRVSADYREADGFIRNTFLDAEADSSELWNTRFKLRFDPSDNFSIISTSSYTENFAGEDNVSPFSGGQPGEFLNASDVLREVAYDTPGREGTETFIQSVNALWQIDENWSLQSITSYQTTDYVRIEDFDVTPAPIAALDRQGDDEAFTEEFRIRYNDSKWNVALGFYFADLTDGSQDEFTVPGTLLNPAIPASVLISRVGTNQSEAQNYAVFLDGEYALTDTVDLLFGARFDDEEQANNQSNITTIVTDIPPGFEFLRAFEGTTTEATEASFNAFLPKGGIRWRASDDVTLAFVAQKAYRAGGAEINFVDGSLIDFSPEFLWNYEFSARTSFLDGKLNWNTNIYYSEWNDQQVLEVLPPPLEAFSQTVNAGQSELYGFESDISYQFSPELNGYFGVGYSVAEFVDFVNSDFDPTQPESPNNQANFGGNRFPFAPEFSFNGGLDYRHANGIFGGIDVSYQSSSFNNIENFTENLADARTLVNARIGYEVTENIAVSAYVRNLFDAGYFTSLGRINGGNFSRLGDPLTWAVRLDVNF